MTEHEHRCFYVVDTMPPTRYCQCGEQMSMTKQDKADYRDYTGKEWED